MSLYIPLGYSIVIEGRASVKPQKPHKGPEMEDNNVKIYGKRRTRQVWLEEDPNGLSYLEEKRDHWACNSNRY